jgi:hypothetical protein
MLSENEALKIELSSEGIQLSPAARQALFTGEKRQVTTDDFATTRGVILRFADHYFVNTPFIDRHPTVVDQTTPHTLEFENNSFWIASGGRFVKAEYIPVPNYIVNPSQFPQDYKDMITTHTDRARISPIQSGCAMACQFCNLGYEKKYHKHEVDDLVESVKVAIDDPILKAHHLLISGGTPKPEDYGYVNEVYRRIPDEFPGLEVDVMMAPIPGLLDAKKLKNAKINELSINLELVSDEAAKRFTPGKYRIGQSGYLSFMDEAVNVFGVGKVRSMLVVGLEGMENTLKGVQMLAERGVSPELSPFVPDSITPLRNHKTPPSEFLKEIYQRARDIVYRYDGVPMGLGCIPCMHNALVLPDHYAYYTNYDPKTKNTTRTYLDQI